MRVYSRYKKKIIIISLVGLCLILLWQMLLSIYGNTQKNNSDSYVPTFHYLEDKSGTLCLSEVRAKDKEDIKTWQSGALPSIGQSRSAWWVKIDVTELPDQEETWFLSITNPTVEQAVLYQPEAGYQGLTYKEYRSGWGFYGDVQDEGFLYPVFKLSEQKVEYPLYLQLSSPNTQNYTITITPERDLNLLKQQTIIMIGIFMGLLFALGISNLLHFLSLKDRAYFYYVLYILFMLLYQGALLGAYRVYLGKLAEVFIANVVILGLFMVIAVILFARAFLDTAKSFPGHDRIAKLVILLCGINIILLLCGWRYEGTILSTLLGDMAGILIFVASIQAVSKGIGRAKYFLAGWSVMLLSVIIFSARVWGIIPNNNSTLAFVLLSAVIEAVLLSAALAKRVRVLRDERENFHLLYKSAEESAVSKEVAYLQAQIKPHFLYNSLNVIAALCRLDAEKARLLILDLSNYLRYSFDFRNLAKYITLDEELEYIQTYIKIEQARFKDKIQVEYELDDTEGLKLPPLILQPLIENAIRHGIRKSKGAGTIILRVRKLSDHYMIEVEDNGIGMAEEQMDKVMKDEQKTGAGVGLANIRRRLKMFYGTELMLKSQLGEGTKVTIILPNMKG